MYSEIPPQRCDVRGTYLACRNFQRILASTTRTDLVVTQVLGGIIL